VWHIRELVGPGTPYPLHLEGPALGRYLAAHASKLIANSHVTASHVRGWLPDDLLEVVPNGIDIDRFTPRVAGAEGGPIVVAMVGSLLSHWKKHMLVVEAAALVDRAVPIEWRFYGHDPSRGGTNLDDPYLRELHARIASAGLAGRFRFPGQVADPVAIMSQIDVLVHPADHESFGRVIVEAMASGLPVVAVRGGGAAELVVDGQTGLLAEKDNPRELAACIERVVRDAALRRALGAAGRRRAEANYSLDACAAGVLGVYEQAMARPLVQSPAPAAATAG
jgi:glycosyltransferase involved in cell wall biosynthesis